MDPSQNKALRNSQNQDKQKEDMRKVTVNAQVTAIISISEVVGCFFILVITTITGTKTVAMFLFRLLEFVVLPYAFLMNTRENKFRIVEEGWSNVFRNTLNSFHLSAPCNNSTEVIPLGHHAATEPESEIYIISKRNRPKSSNKFGETSFNINSLNCNLNVPFEDKPSTSTNFSFVSWVWARINVNIKF